MQDFQCGCGALRKQRDTVTKRMGGGKRHFKGVTECGVDMHRQALRDMGALTFSINILFNQDQNSKVILRGKKQKNIFLQMMAKFHQCLKVSFMSSSPVHIPLYVNDLLETNLKQNEAQSTRAESTHKVEFMYLVLTRMPGKSYCRQLRSLLLCLCDVFGVLIIPLAC